MVVLHIMNGRCSVCKYSRAEHVALPGPPQGAKRFPRRRGDPKQSLILEQMGGNPVLEFMRCDICGALSSVQLTKAAHLLILLSKLREQLVFWFDR